MARFRTSSATTANPGSGFFGTCCLNCRVESQKVRLKSNFIDGLYYFACPGYFSHRGRRLFCEDCIRSGLYWSRRSTPGLRRPHLRVQPNPRPSFRWLLKHLQNRTNLLASAPIFSAVLQKRFATGVLFPFSRGLPNRHKIFIMAPLSSQSVDREDSFNEHLGQPRR